MTVTVIDIIILGLATWRFASLLANEDGPFEILAKFRRFVGVRSMTGFDVNNKPALPTVFGTNELAKMVLCVWCNSVWIGLVITLFYALFPVTAWLCLPFALSALAIIIDTALQAR